MQWRKGGEGEGGKAAERRKIGVSIMSDAKRQKCANEQ